MGINNRRRLARSATQLINMREGDKKEKSGNVCFVTCKKEDLISFAKDDAAIKPFAENDLAQVTLSKLSVLESSSQETGKKDTQAEDNRGAEEQGRCPMRLLAGEENEVAVVQDTCASSNKERDSSEAKKTRDGGDKAMKKEVCAEAVEIQTEALESQQRFSGKANCRQTVIETKKANQTVTKGSNKVSESSNSATKTNHCHLISIADNSHVQPSSRIAKIIQELSRHVNEKEKKEDVFRPGQHPVNSPAETAERKEKDEGRQSIDTTSISFADAFRAFHRK